MTAAELSARWRAATPGLKEFPAIESAIAVILILLFSNALLGPLLADPTQPDGSPILRLVWPPAYAAALGLALLQPERSLRTALRGWPVLALAVLPLLSVLWSIDPGLTGRRSIAVLATALCGLWLAARFDWRALLRLFGIAFAILAFGALVAGAAFPGFGVMHEIHPGAWRGLWWEKNTLGAMMAWSALAFCAAAAAAPTAAERRFWIGLVPLALGLVLLSTSKTALLASLVAVGGAAAVAVSRRGFGFASLTLFGGAVVVAAGLGVLIIGPGVLLEALGRDATLTGRTDIWEVLIRKIGEAPWFGYGYGAFWSAPDGPAFWVRLETAWPVPTAHNAWLETALALGVPGTAFAAMTVLVAIGKALRRLFSGVETYWALPFLASWLVVSLSESALLEQNGFVWLMLSATMFKLYAERPSARRRAAP